MGKSIETIVTWTCDKCEAEAPGDSRSSCPPSEWKMWGFQALKTHPVKDLVYCGKCYSQLMCFVGPVDP